MHQISNNLTSESKLSGHTKLEYIRLLLDAVEAKDLKTSMSYFSEHAVFVDPHYPKVRMNGKFEIREGIKWGFKTLKEFKFTIENSYISTDKQSVIVKVRTAHILPNGRLLDFHQIFAAWFKEDKIYLLEAFVQYGPHGAVGLMLLIHRLKNKLLLLARTSHQLVK